MGKFHILPSYQKAFESKARTIACCGTAASGKSKFFAYKTLFRLINEDEPFRALCVRKVKEDIRESVFANLVEIIESGQWAHAFKITESPMRIKRIDKSNDIIFRGIDEPNKLKSINGIKHIWVEEATELEQEDYNQLQYRLRGVSDTYKQVCLTFNPSTPGHWIKSRFFDNHEPDSYVFNTNFKDNPYLDESDKNQMLINSKSSKTLYDNLTLGIWSERQTGSEFYHNFSTTAHLQEYAFDPSLPLHLSFDFNVHPYCTLEIAQMTGDERRFIHEICLPYPKSNTYEVCREFKKWLAHPRPFPKGREASQGSKVLPIGEDLGGAVKVEGIYIYGDPSGRHIDTRSRVQDNDFGIIREELKEYNPVFRIAEAAYSVKKRGEWINKIFAGENELKIYVSPKCPNLVQDLLHVKQDANGAKLKEKYKMESGVVCEKYGHASDAMDYLLCQTDMHLLEKYCAPRARFAPIYRKKGLDNRWW